MSAGLGYTPSNDTCVTVIDGAKLYPAEEYLD